MEETPRQKNLRENVLKVGVCTLEEAEERVKAFRVMNTNSRKKRYLISREEIVDQNNTVILKKTQEVDIPVVKLLRRNFKPDKVIKTFQPDEGILIISDMSLPEGVSLTMDIVTQIMNLGGGAYEGFIDRVDSLSDFSDFLKKTLFPRIVIIGYLPKNKVEGEIQSLAKIKKIDNFLRFIELTHESYKPNPVFPFMKQIIISKGDTKSWGRFVVDIIKEYTRPYMLEDVS